ncbi:MAG: DUF4252 domain-containing protein [Bacteroidales bacterium]|nr:DUF4252 domain-containing protein [Bacteroidales bacterium]
MRRLLSILSLLIIPMVSFAQMSDLEEIYEEYAGKEGCESYIYGKRMISMMQENASNDVKKLLGGIDKIRIISAVGDSGSLQSKVISAIEGDYELISRMDEGGSSSRFYLYDTGDKHSKMSFVMVNSTSDRCVILEIIGKFDVKDISKLSVIGQK